MQHHEFAGSDPLVPWYLRIKRDPGHEPRPRKFGSSTFPSCPGQFLLSEERCSVKYRVRNAGTVEIGRRYRAYDDDAVELARRQLTRAIVGRSPARPVAALRANYDQIRKTHEASTPKVGSPRRGVLNPKIIAAILERALSHPLHVYQDCLSKPGPKRGDVYDELVRLTAGCRPEALNADAWAIALRCSPRTVNRLFERAAEIRQGAHMQQTQVQVIRHEHHHVIDHRITIVGEAKQMPVIPAESNVVQLRPKRKAA